jgi:hypothetical protein
MTLPLVANHMADGHLSASRTPSPASEALLLALTVVVLIDVWAVGLDQVALRKRGQPVLLV